MLVHIQRPTPQTCSSCQSVHMPSDHGVVQTEGPITAWQQWLSLSFYHAVSFWGWHLQLYVPAWLMIGS